MKTAWLIAGLGVAMGLGWASVAAAADTAERLLALETQVAELESRPLPGWLDGLRLGGYGELHYNNLDGEGGAADKDEIDLHRFVLFVGYEFNERTRFNSELEFEHLLTGDDKPGYVQLEQAYLDFDWHEQHTARAGVFILPLGLLNTTHEPNTFYGVERNRVENRILPTTWFEGGAGLLGDLGSGLRYEAYLHSGLNTTTNAPYVIRDGRQKVAEAEAADPAATLGLNWSQPGLTLGGGVQYQTDITQGRDPEAGGAWLGELHLDWRQGPFGLRALYAEWALEGDGPASTGADRQYGWYVEPSWRPLEKLGFFVRYEQLDEKAGAAETPSRKSQWSTGANYWPLEPVVLKADYQWQDNEDGKEQNGFNLGLGYVF